MPAAFCCLIPPSGLRPRRARASRWPTSRAGRQIPCIASACLAFYDSGLGARTRNNAKMRAFPRLLAAIAGCWLPAAALGYSVMLHDRLPDVFLSYPELGLEARAAVPDAASLAHFREQIYRLLVSTEDAELRA